MAVGDPYATVPQYRAFKRSERDSLFLEWCLEAVSRVLDLKCSQPGNGFNKDDTVTARVYGPRDQIHPIASTAGLVVKLSSGVAINWAGITALVLDTGYELLPHNPAPGWPYTGISLLTSSPVTPIIDPVNYRSSDYRLQVTAIHGWPSVPRAIQRACLELTAILEQSSIFLTNRVQEDATSVIEASPQGRAILKSLYEAYNPYPIGVA